MRKKLLIFLGIILLGLVVLAGYTIYDKYLSNKDVSKSDGENSLPEETEVDINSDLIKELYSFIITESEFDIEQEIFWGNKVYNMQKITLSNISNAERLIVSYKLLKPTDYLKVDYSLMPGYVDETSFDYGLKQCKDINNIELDHYPFFM